MKIHYLADKEYRDVAPVAIYLEPEAFDAFVKALENPAPPNARLRQLFATPAPWETLH